MSKLRFHYLGLAHLETHKKTLLVHTLRKL